MRRFNVISYIFLIFISRLCLVASLEPITTGIAVAAAVAGSAMLATYDKLYCWRFECCEKPWIEPNLYKLTVQLKQKLHGQHLVKDSVVKALKGHLMSKSPTKALVMSFHGWTGGGKNFVSRMIAESLYKKGMDSKFVNLFVSTLHFPHQSQIETYKDQLREWIKGNVSECAQPMFVFDEMDKMPKGLLDTIKPYIDHYENINGVDYRRAIFIFLSNTAGNGITKRTFEQWQNGASREDITYKEMEELITVGAYNEDGGGLWHSELIEKNLINVFVPFLPMERHHVKQCIMDDLNAKNHTITNEIVDKVADELQYFPKGTRLYSKSGCKRVSQKVDFVIEDLELEL